MTVAVCSEHSGMCKNYEKVNEKVDKNDTENRDDHRDMWTAINNLRNRLPTWTTLFISGLTFFLGIAVTIIGVLLNK